MMIVASPDQNEHMRRSAFDCWMAAMCEVKSVTPSLKELEHELHVGHVPLENGLVGLPAVVAVGVVVPDAGDGLDPPELPRRQHAGDDGLDLVVHALEGPARVWHRLLDTLLRGAVLRG